MLSYEDSLLCLEGRPVQRLADELTTPFFIFSEALLRENYTAMARGLDQGGLRTAIRYCAKANYEPAVLEVLASLGSQLLASHMGEVQLALDCGFPVDQISYQRPGLLEEELRGALAAGVSHVHLYRLQDLPLIEKVASEQGLRIKLSIRIKADWPALRLSPLALLSRRMGLGETEIIPAAKRIRDSQWLTLAALNLHRGTQLKSPAIYRPGTRRLARLAARLARETGEPLEEINLGGGLPSPSLGRLKLSTPWRRLADKPDPLAREIGLEGFSCQISEIFQDEVAKAGLDPTPRLVVEPGRAIVGNAAVLVTRVLAAQGRWIFLDASRNHLGESKLLFTRRVLPAIEGKGRPWKRYHLSGSTLNTMDLIDFGRRLPHLARGDVLVLCDAGAYSLSRSTRYADFSPAAYMLKEDGSLSMIRRREDLSDVTAAALRPTADGEPSR
jgi:diaminopimelate decarboxylase